jgi:Fur family transcriptional regulator, peroxide stress response regulator
LKTKKIVSRICSFNGGNRLDKIKVEKQKKLDLLKTLCRRRGLPLTVQRRVIFDALLERTDHPTVDQVFEGIKRRIPGVSRTTVYRTLETLAELGIVRRANHFEATARFDGNTEHHHHLVCLRCDKVSDYHDSSLKSIRLPDARRSGFKIVDFSVYFEGLCPHCKRTRAGAQRLKHLRRSGQESKKEK